MLYHERWHVEVVIDETRTHLRLSARTLRSLTPEGVIQEIYALLLAHTVVRMLMLQAAEQAQIAATQISFTETIRIMDESLIPLGLVSAPRRLHMVQGLIREIGQQRLPKQRVRIAARVVKRVRSRYDARNLSICIHLLWNLISTFTTSLLCSTKTHVDPFFLIEQYWGALLPQVWFVALSWALAVSKTKYLLVLLPLKEG